MLEESRTNNDALPPPTPGFSNTMAFVPAGKVPKRATARKESSLMDTAWEWKMQVDLDQKLNFPPEIITTSLRLVPILWSASQKALFIIELTVPWEDAAGEAYKCKKLKYSDLATEA